MSIMETRSYLVWQGASFFLKQEWTLPSSAAPFIHSGFVKMYG